MPGAQASRRQAPVEQRSPSPQWVAQLPQYWGSVWSSTQVRPFDVEHESGVEAAQLTLQSPLEHARAPVAPPETGGVQTVVQSPQWSASLVVLMHCPPQFVVPPGQDTMQAPPEQTSFCPQARLHCPQC